LRIVVWGTALYRRPLQQLLNLLARIATSPAYPATADPRISTASANDRVCGHHHQRCRGEGRMGC